MQQKRPLFLLIAIIAVILAIWSSMLLLAPSQQTLDQRVHTIGEQLKCPICQGESVADSPSLLAQQMRATIRQQVQAGKSQSEIIQYFQSRYGEQIVWTPQWQGLGLLAWLAPIALLLGGAVMLSFTLREWRTLAPTPATIRATLSPGPTPVPDEVEQALARIDQAELAHYRTQLAQELAATDPLFERYRTEDYT